MVYSSNSNGSGDVEDGGGGGGGGGALGATASAIGYRPGSLLSPASSSKRSANLPWWRRVLGAELAGEAPHWGRIAWPVALSVLLEGAMNLTDAAYLGHLDTRYLASSSVAQVWMIVTGQFAVQAVASALNSLAAQAFGAKNEVLAAVWCRIGILACAGLMLPVTGLWWWSDKIFVALGVEPDHAELAAVYLRWSLLGFFQSGVLGCFTVYLQAQHLVLPTLAVAVVSVGMNVGFNQLFIHGAGDWHGLGYIGSPIATSASRTVACVGLWLYCLYAEQVRGTLRHVQFVDCLRSNRWRAFGVQQLLPQLLSQALEWWQLEAVAYIAVRLGPTAIATHNAVMTLFYMLSAALEGLGIATGVRIGNHLGANQVRLARAVAKLGAIGCVIAGAVSSLLLVLLQDWVGKIFSDDPAVIRETSGIMLPVAIGFLLASVLYSAMGVLDGQARPGPSSVAFILGLWVVCLPCSYLLAFQANMGLAGVWWALVIGYCVVAIVTTTAVLRSDWEDCAARATETAETSTHLLRHSGQEE